MAPAPAFTIQYPAGLAEEEDGGRGAEEGGDKPSAVVAIIVPTLPTRSPSSEKHRGFAPDHTAS